MEHANHGEMPRMNPARLLLTADGELQPDFFDWPTLEDWTRETIADCRSLFGVELDRGELQQLALDHAARLRASLEARGDGKGLMHLEAFLAS